MTSLYTAGVFNADGREHDYHVWQPQPLPALPGHLVLFEHGTYAPATQSKWLMEALATAGYTVVATTSQDGGSYHPFNKPAAWTDAFCRHRLDDMTVLLDWVIASSGLNCLPGVTVIGHSLGGYAALGIGGAWPSWKDHRVSRVIGLSPYSAPYSLNGSLGTMALPVQLQGGTRDVGITPTLDAVYGLLKPPKQLVVFKGAGHFDWSNTLCGAVQTADCLLQVPLASLIAKFAAGFINGQPVPGKPAGVTRNSVQM